jgi:hypothetical protein
MANVPVIASYTHSDSGGNGVSSLNCTLPSGAVAGSFVGILIGEDETASVTYSATGFVERVNYGDGTSDAQIGFLTGYVTAGHVSDGYITVSSTGNDEKWATVMRLTDVDESDPINTSAGNPGNNGATEYCWTPTITTTRLCLVIGAISWDGGDAHPIAIHSGSSQVWKDNGVKTIQSGTSGNDSCGAWAFYRQSAVGGTSSLAFYTSNKDDSIRTQFAIQGLAVYEEPTDAEADGTSTAQAVAGPTIPTIANAAGTSTAQETWKDPRWWTMDLPTAHFTFDDDTFHTFDGWHQDNSTVEVEANADGTSTAQAISQVIEAEANATGTSTVQADATPRYDEVNADSVGTSIVAGKAAYILNISKGEGSGTARPKLVEDFYFDASDSAITDSTNEWGNDALAFDGDINTYAEISGTFSNQNLLSAIGTTADPTWDYKIIEVLFDFYTSGATNARWTVSCDIDGNFVSFGYDFHEEPGWQNYPDEYSLPTPGYFQPPNDFNKWTWVNVARLELLGNIDSTSGWYRLHAGKVVVTYRGEIDFGSSKIKTTKAQADGTSETLGESAIVYAPDVDVTGTSAVDGLTGNISGIEFSVDGISETLGDIVDGQSPYDETDADAVGESIANANTGAIKESSAEATAESVTDGRINGTLGTVAEAQAISETLGETQFLSLSVISADGISDALANVAAFWLTDTSAIAESTASADSGALFLTELAADGTSEALGEIENIGTLEYEQEGFRFRNDNGTEITATWLAGQDTNITADKGTIFRLRMATCVTGNPLTSQATLQVRAVGDSEWVTIPVGDP